MDEEWVEIPDFEQYSVSTLGRVRNNRFDRLLVQHLNNSGTTYVGLFDGNKQRIKSVSRLVADNLVPNIYVHLSDLYPFDTPIHLDGDRSNNAVTNLAWRPRWWAIEYQLQFSLYHPRISEPLFETKHGITLDDSWAAAKHFGLLEISHISEPTNNDRSTWFGLKFHRISRM